MRCLTGALVVAFAAAGFGCKTKGGAAVKDSISGASNRGLDLGSGYDSPSRSASLAYCVKGGAVPEITSKGGSIASLSIDTSSTYQDMQFALTGDANAAVKVNTSADAGLTAKIALNHAADENSKKWTYMWKAESGVRQFNGNVTISDVGASTVAAGDQAVKSACGDSYVDQIIYGAAILATFRIDFGNTQDKHNYGGKLNLAVKDGIFKIDANANVDTTKIATKSSVSIKVDQIGGDATGILGVAAENIITCDFSNIDPCLKTMENVRKYAEGSFTQALNGATANDTTKWVPVTYITKTYASAGLTKLAVPPQDPSDRDDLDYQIQTMGEEFNAMNQNQQRAQRILAAATQMGLTSAEEAAVKTFSTNNAHNIQVYQTSIEYCQRQVSTYAACLKYYKEKTLTRKSAVDPEALVKIDVPDRRLALFKTDAYGGFGGTDFDASAAMDAAMKVQKIEIFSNDRWADAMTITTTGNQSFRYGSPTGKLVASAVLADGETIEQVEFALLSPDNSTERVSYMKVITSKNQTIAAGVDSKNRYVFTAPTGTHILGFYGKQGQSIDRAGAIYAYDTAAH